MNASPQSPVFDDGKAPGALRTIGEVSQALGIRQHVLRYWEEQFSSLQPVKRSGGRRYYRPDDVALIAKIDRLVNQEGYTLRGARKALQTHASSTSSQSLKDAPSLSPDGEAAFGPALREIRDRLVTALDRAS